MVNCLIGPFGAFSQTILQFRRFMTGPSTPIVNLLLVVDCPDQGQSLREAFARSPHLRIAAVVRIGEAFTYLMPPESTPLARRPDLLVIDLPDSTPPGIQTVLTFLRQMKTRAELQGIPYVVLCDERTFHAISEMPEGGIPSLIKKSADPASLGRMVHHFGEYWGTVARIPPQAASPAVEEATKIAQETNLSENPESDPIANLRTIEILVVDDNDDDATLFQESLAESGRVRVSQILDDGETALQFLRKQGPFSNARSPDLVVLDIHMPRKTGLMLLEEIQADARLRQLPVVMLSASRREQDIWDAYSRGSCAFVEKPPRFEHFREIAVRFANYWALLAHLPPSRDE